MTPPAPLQGVGLFSGIGGIELAMQRNGVQTVAMCEIDKSATRVLNHRFPGIPVFDDVRKVTGDALRDLGAVPDRTVLSGGFPCTDLSVAGRRAGMDRGTRSGLFWEIVRILGEFPAAWVVLENVPGLLSATCPCPGDGLCVARTLTVRCPGELHTVPGGACGGGGCISIHGGAMGAVLGALGDLGYGYAYRVLDSQHFGVPQRRRRVVIVGRRAGGAEAAAPAEVLLEPESRSGDPAARIAPWPVPARRAPGSAGNSRGVHGTGGGVVPAVTAKWAKGTGGPSGDEAQNLIVNALTSSMAGAGGESTTTRPRVGTSSWRRLAAGGGDLEQRR